MKRICICLFFFFCVTEALHIETHRGCTEEYYNQIMAPMFKKQELAGQRFSELARQMRMFESDQSEKDGDLENYCENRQVLLQKQENYFLESCSYNIITRIIKEAMYYAYGARLDKKAVETHLTEASELYSILSSFDSESANSKQHNELRNKCDECEKLFETTGWLLASDEEISKEHKEEGNFGNEVDIFSETEDQKFIEEKEFDTSFEEDSVDSKPLSLEYEETTSPLSKEEQIADIKYFEQQCIENSRIEEEKTKVQNAYNAILAAKELIYFELDDPSLVDMKDIKVSNEQGLRQQASEVVEREFQRKRDIIRAECSAQIRFINGEGFVKDPEPLVMVSGHGLPMKHTVSMEGLLNSDQNRMQRLRQEELQKIGESDLQRVAKMVPFVGALMDYNYGRISEKECIEHLSVDALTTFAPVGSLAKGISFSKSLLKKKQPIKQLMVDTQEFTTKMKISEKPLDEFRHATINTDFVIANDNTITMSGKVAVGESAGIGRASSSVVGSNSYGGVKAKSYNTGKRNVKGKEAEKALRTVCTKSDADSYIKGIIQKNVLSDKRIAKDGREYFEIKRKFEYMGTKFKKGQFLERDTMHHEWEYFQNKDTHLGAINPLNGKLDISKMDPSRTLKVK